MKVKIKHVEDGVTDVIAKVIFEENDINLEYRFKGMTYGLSIGVVQAVKLGIIKCHHPNMNPILGFENMEIGEICTLCNEEFYYSKANSLRNQLNKTAKP